MSKIPAAVSAVVMATLSAIATPAFACENDAQCKGDRVCSNGECVEPPSRGAQGATTAPPGPSPAATQGPPPAATAPSSATMAPPPQAGAPGAYPPPAAYYPAPGAYPPGAYALPPGSAPPAAPRMRRRVGLLVTGSVLGGVGVLGLVIGGVTYAAGSASSSLCDAGYYSYSYSSYDSCSDSGTRAAGAVVMVGSGLLVAAAIPLIIVGARKVPVEKEDASSRGVTVAIQPRPAGLGLVGTF
jgi:hypothetical protein